MLKLYMVFIGKKYKWDKIFQLSIVVVICLSLYSFQTVYGKPFVEVYEVEYGLSNAAYNDISFQTDNNYFNLNLLFYQDYKSEVESLFSNEHLRSYLERKVALKFPVSLKFSSLDYQPLDNTMSELETRLWGLSTGTLYQTGYAYELGYESSLELLNHYSIGASYFFLNQVNRDSIESSVFNNSYLPMVTNSIEGFSILDETGSSLNYSLKGIGLQVSYRNIQNIKGLVFPQWILTKTIDFGVTELTNLYLVYILKEYKNYMPVANFILKFGLNYLLSDIKRYQKHYPFPSTPSFLIRTYSVGLTIIIGDLKW
jgi:hypothetical protein